MATLLKRSDAPLYYIHVGSECADFVQWMTRAHCFEMKVVLQAPHSPMSESGLSKYIQGLDCHAGKNWFQCSWTQAVAIFGSVLVESDVQAKPARVESTAWNDPCAEPVPPIIMETSVEDPTESSEVESDGRVDVSMVDDPLWEFVSPCSTRHASKSVEIRAALVLRLGKDRATQLLAKATATVARDGEGRKNRVLRIGGQFLKVKPP
jgi:hypothetical protein